MKDLADKLRTAWGPDTAVPGTVGDGPVGQCAVTALVVQDLLGGELLRAEVGGCSHYWNLIPGMGEVDLTRAQFLTNAEIPRGVIVPRSRLLDGERAKLAQTLIRYERLRAKVGL